MRWHWNSVPTEKSNSGEDRKSQYLTNLVQTKVMQIIAHACHIRLGKYNLTTKDITKPTDITARLSSNVKLLLKLLPKATLQSHFYCRQRTSQFQFFYIQQQKCQIALFISVFSSILCNPTTALHIIHTGIERSCKVQIPFLLLPYPFKCSHSGP